MTPSYVEQRLAAIAGTSIQKEENDELVRLREENEKLKGMLSDMPPINLISEAQKAFENSPEFAQVYNFFLVRFLNDKFGDEYRQSPQWLEMQRAATEAFVEFEKKGAKKDGQVSDKSTQRGSSPTAKKDA